MTQVTAPGHGKLLATLGIETAKPVAATHDGTAWLRGGSARAVRTPIDDSLLASIEDSTPAQVDACIAAAHAAFEAWRLVPAPKRGDVVRAWGERLRAMKAPLGQLVSLEMGKSLQEGLGEVQEIIDICDFATGLSRQLYGKTMHSERPQHRMYEQWHPLGVVGVITAFNFPMAVYGWNAALALACGDTLVWKPSEKTPLTAVALHKILHDVAAEHGHPGIATLIQGAADPVGAALVADRRVALVSATGSVRMGYHVGAAVARRMGRSLLELGGNNGIIVTPSADLELALTAILFGAVGTAGQRCTSTRRIIVHESIRHQLIDRLVRAYRDVRIGDPRETATLMGPLVTRNAVRDLLSAVDRVRSEGGEILFGGEVLEGDDHPGGHWVTPCIASARNEYRIVQEETFAPILYIIGYGRADATPAQAVADIEEAVRIHNDVPQGLSSAIFTEHVREAEYFLSQRGSDCGIANVNIGTSGAEIGGAFGGEKETGGGRESGSDAWKSYMRRQTNTVNWSTELPLAQGIRFGSHAR